MNFGLVWVNGRIREGARSSVRAHDAGFLHGLGIYETLPVRRGKPVFLLEHLERMEEGRRSLRIPLLRWGIPGAVEALVRESGAVDAALRITLTRGTEKGPTLAIGLRPLPEAKSPVRLVLSSFVKSAADPWETVKTTCRARNAIAREDAELRGAFDALLLTTEGDISEGTVTNFYLVREGTLVTPPLDRGILPGVTREKLLAGCRKLGIEALEERILPKDLRRAQEILVSNSLVGLLEAEELIGVWRKESSGEGATFRKLRDYYEEEVKRYLEVAR